MGTGTMTRWWGPVFEAERITRSRRWQGYAVRSLFVLGLLGGLSLPWFELGNKAGEITLRRLATVGQEAFLILTMLELIAVLLLAPAATAGAICVDKSRGTLAHVFVTDLTNREIVLGKLAARLGPVLGLLACSLPVSALLTLLGGVDPVALTGAFLIAAGVAVLGCSLALMLSVWASRPREVLSVSFGAWIAWLLACPLYQFFCQIGRAPNWLAWANPFYLALAPYNHPGETSLVEPILFALACAALGIGCVVVAVRQVRAVGCRSPRVEAGKPRGIVGRVALASIRWSPGRRWGPTLDRDPLLWREWHRGQSTRWSRRVWLAFIAISSVACGQVLVDRLTRTTAPPWDVAGMILGLTTSVALLLISTEAPSVLAEERERGSLDVLISTPVSTRAIVRAKWWGAFRRVPWLAAWPALIGAVYILAGDLGRVETALVCLTPVVIVVQGAALVSVGLALATWVRRTGQATAWSITLLIAAVVGWPLLGTMLALRPLIASQMVYGVREAVADNLLEMGSPLANASSPFQMAVQTWSGPAQRFQLIHRQALLILMIGWTLAYALLAWGLFEATVRTFDRCLGRAPEHARTPRLAPPPGPRRGRSGARQIRGNAGGMMLAPAGPIGDPRADGSGDAPGRERR